MSADLLRRAAVKLREHAERAPGGPWKVQYFGDRGYPQRIINDGAVLIAETFEGPPSPAWCPEYIALMHPPVALALADLLGAVADQTAALRHPTRFGDYNSAVALAREILREPQP